MTEPPECGPEDVEFTLSWSDAGGALQGDLVAENVSGHACRLSGKPDVIPLGADGLSLDAGTVWTMEYRVPDHVVLSPGQRATAPVAWGGWDGPAASGRVIVTWPGGRKEIQVLGPRQPTPSATGAMPLSTSWFRPERGR